MIKAKMGAMAFAPLFSAGAAKDETYVSLRDSEHPEDLAVRGWCEELWRSFGQHADDNFLREIRDSYDARFGEMYLTCTLSDFAHSRGYKMRCPKPGPDVLLEKDGRRIWVEAVTITNGEDNENHPGHMDLSSTFSIDSDKITLRYTTAIRDKWLGYRKYVCNGTIAAEDAFIIAMNSYPLTMARFDRHECPFVLKAVFPFGDLVVEIDRQHENIVAESPAYQPDILKANGETVSKDSFLSDTKKGVSAVLASRAGSHSRTKVLGSDFQIVHNPNAASPIDLHSLPAHREWTAKIDAHRIFATPRDGLLCIRYGNPA